MDPRYQLLIDSVEDAKNAHADNKNVVLFFTLMKQLYTILAEEGIHVNIALRVLDSMEKYSLENLEDIDTAKKKIYYLDKESKKAEQSNLLSHTLHDFKSSACIIPTKDKILALFFTQKSQLIDAWESLEGVEEYAYWNNADQPEDLSESEWEQRKADWDIALPGVGVPSENGMLVNFTEGFPPPFCMKIQNDISKYVPDIEERAKRISNALVFRNKIEELKNNTDPEIKENIYFYLTQWKNSEEGKQEVDRKFKEIKELLPKEITLELLKTDFSDLIKKEE